MKKGTVINLGYTFDYLGLGVLFILGGGICFLANIILAIFLLLFGILLLLLRTGIEVDTTKKKVRKYFDLFSIRFGNWIYATSLKKVELKATNESQTMNSRGGSKTYHTKSYDIILFGKFGTPIELNEFIDYNVACQTLMLISESFGLESRNEVEAIRAIARKSTRERK